MVTYKLCGRCSVKKVISKSSKNVLRSLARCLLVPYMPLADSPLNFATKLRYTQLFQSSYAVITLNWTISLLLAHFWSLA